MKKIVFSLLAVFVIGLTACAPKMQAIPTEAQPSPLPSAEAQPAEAQPSSQASVEATPEIYYFTMYPNFEKSGSVLMDGTGQSYYQEEPYLTGDDAANTTWWSFLSFDFNDLLWLKPVQRAILFMECGNANGSPESLGGIRVALYPYGEFDPFALSNASPRGAEDIFGEVTCPTTALDVTDTLLRLMENGETAFQVIIAPVNGSNNNSIPDSLEIRFPQINVDFRPEAAMERLATQPTATEAPTACTDVLQFVSDLNVQDNQVLDPRRIFTKGWRLKNAGTCTWDSTYTVTFIGGEQMDAPDYIPLPGVVPPGGTVDVYVDLVAPEAEGVHQATFELRNPAGYAIGTPFWVKIKVQSIRGDADGQEPLQPETFTVEPKSMNSWGVASNGSSSVTFYVGDDEYNNSWMTLLDFGMNDIQPPNVQSASLVLDCAPQSGDLFANLGGFEVYSAAYSYAPTSGGSLPDVQPLEFLGSLTSRCVPVEFDVTTSLQRYFDNMSGMPYQIVISPVSQTNNDGVADMIFIPSARLVITGTP